MAFTDACLDAVAETSRRPAVRDALLLAARRLGQGTDERPVDDGVSRLRPEQRRILGDFAGFLLDVASDAKDGASPYGRIILPPRTGKTVVAAHLIARTQLATTFIVPTRTLVEQTVREMEAHAPGVPVGAFYGDRKLTVDGGVNVTTYQMLTTALEEERLPPEMRASALVFADEGHRAMTARRMAVLQQAFDPTAVRVALTATPDYDDEVRQLARFFPSLVHEMSAEEAQSLGLLAPLRVCVAEVDANASSVRLLAGDYEAESLGRLMSSAPFFQVARHFRYIGDNASCPCLVACTSRQQAYDLQQFLSVHRPSGSPAPALVLGSTPSVEREAVLARFEAGEIDTIVQVGVLVEGWSSPRCKLLIDLAPSLSRVRATQKFFRVMTRFGDQEARIYMLIPAELPVMPILPMEIFGGSEAADDLAGALVPGEDSGTPGAAVRKGDGCPVAGVTVRKRVVLASRFAKPLLDTTAPDQIRAVMESCPEWNPEAPCTLFRFRWLFFQHELFVGRGDFLLRFLGVPRTTRYFAGLVMRLYPDVIATQLLGLEAQPDVWCADEVALLESVLLESARAGEPNRGLVAQWEALNRGPWPDVEDPFSACARAEDAALLSGFLDAAGKKQRAVMVRHFGLEGTPAHTVAEIADLLDVSRSRAGQILKGGLMRLQWRLIRDSDGTIGWRFLNRPSATGMHSPQPPSAR